MTLGRVAWPALAVLALALGGAAGLRAPRVPDAPYPETRRDSVVETLFGERIADPYRWLENDVRGDPEVADWVRRENAYTEGYLATLPAREWFASHIRELTDYERFGLPRKAGRRYFYLHNRGLQNQSVLEVRDGLDGTARLLLDPNTWQADGTAALDPELWEPSPDGRLLAYGVQQSGSDWRVIHVLDVKRAKVLADELRWVNQSSIAWTDRHGFLYSRFPAPRPGEEFHALNLNHALWYHRVGTAQAADSLVYATPAHPEWNHTARVTSDHRFAVITTSLGTDARHEIHVIDLAAGRRRNWEVRPLVQGFTHDWTLVDSIGSVLWFVTNWQAPRCRLMTIDLAEPLPQWHEVVREGPEVLQQASIIGDELILTYLHHAATRAFVVDLHGGPLRALSLNEIGTAAGFHGKP
ncbi:MAG: S9 family peptidase, partial [Sphingomonadales bacterium]|nr:S9 family peptidase [Sphingomonadales bacterium]